MAHGMKGAESRRSTASGLSSDHEIASMAILAIPNLAIPNLSNVDLSNVSCIGTVHATVRLPLSPSTSASPVECESIEVCFEHGTAWMSGIQSVRMTNGPTALGILLVGGYRFEERSIGFAGLYQLALAVQDSQLCENSH